MACIVFYLLGLLNFKYSMPMYIKIDRTSTLWYYISTESHSLILVFLTCICVSLFRNYKQTNGVGKNTGEDKNQFGQEAMLPSAPISWYRPKLFVKPLSLSLYSTSVVMEITGEGRRLLLLRLPQLWMAYMVVQPTPAMSELNTHLWMLSL